MLPKIVAVLALLVAGAGEVRAETIGAYVQGYGSMAGETDALMTGSGTSALGGGVGFRGGVHLGPFSGYYDRDTFFHGSSAVRAIFAFSGGFPIGPVRLVLEIGGGGVWENKGAIDGDILQGKREGLVARGGIGIEAPIYSHIVFGVALEDEYYAVHDSTMPVTQPSDVHTGSDYLGTAYIKVAFGL